MVTKSNWCIRIHEHGDATKLIYEKIESSQPSSCEARVKIIAAGVNFIDIYQREGLYPLVLPSVLGNECIGFVDSVGKEVTQVKVGDLVGLCTAGTGCYAQFRNVVAQKLVILPTAIKPIEWASILLKGLTAEYLSRRCWPIRSGDIALVTAASGGVGEILCQMLVALGAKVVGVVGSENKVAKAESAGCSRVLCGYQNFDQRVRETHSKGVSVVFDSVGKISFESSLNSLAPRGCLVSYGNASGPTPEFALLELAKRGSLFVTRPTLANYFTTTVELKSGIDTLLGLLRRGLRIPKITTWPLAKASEAQIALQSRKLDGVAVLTVAD